MPFVMRDGSGQVLAIYREMSAGAEEYLPPTHPAVQAFMQQNVAQLPVSSAEKPAMLQSDLDMIRVYEDLTDILLTKNLVMLTDFPPAAQDKLMRRKRLRSSLSPITELLDNTDEDEHDLP
ncbi:MAG: hypothetical protein IPK59_02315 [Rhodospirillaceae bacterium]|nr:hypothetical protein [Rhodospirillaceae bacterium]